MNSFENLNIIMQNEPHNLKSQHLNYSDNEDTESSWKITFNQSPVTNLSEFPESWDLAFMLLKDDVSKRIQNIITLTIQIGKNRTLQKTALNQLPVTNSSAFLKRCHVLFIKSNNDISLLKSVDIRIT